METLAHNFFLAGYVVALAAAAAYVDALHKIRDGHHALAQKNISYTAPGLRGLLGPYTAVLQNALMKMHKAF